MGDRSAVTRSLHLVERKNGSQPESSVLMTLRMGVYIRDKETPRYRGESRGRSLIKRSECSGGLADDMGGSKCDESANFPPMQPHSLTHSLARARALWLLAFGFAAAVGTFSCPLYAFPIVVEISVSAHGSRTPSQRCSFHG
ncbi:hypothetical protein An09g04670 [Aspergillus niger]|uniref:Uncharacterized protein n=2 Tax=Aspergillus niger TaxID=5061 RepID=A2QU78_ASPNC|nr:hypothetical protein An09g04670 [Aspergillus niger]CAK40321.1 hypothetical protein An09g04670 [Aspergillus niger]